MAYLKFAFITKKTIGKLALKRHDGNICLASENDLPKVEDESGAAFRERDGFIGKLFGSVLPVIL